MVCKVLRHVRTESGAELLDGQPSKRLEIASGLGVGSMRRNLLVLCAGRRCVSVECVLCFKNRRVWRTLGRWKSDGETSGGAYDILPVVLELPAPLKECKL